MASQGWLRVARKLAAVFYEYVVVCLPKRHSQYSGKSGCKIRGGQQRDAKPVTLVLLSCPSSVSPYPENTCTIQTITSSDHTGDQIPVSGPIAKIPDIDIDPGLDIDSVHRDVSSSSSVCQ
jgi:hypothetical protein